MQDVVVEAGGDPAPGEGEPDRVLPACEGEQAGGVDGPLNLDRSSGLDRPGTDRWRTGRSATVGEELMQVGEAEPGRDGLEADTVEEQVNDSGVGPDGDVAAGMSSSEPELLSADAEVPGGRERLSAYS